MTQTTPKTVAQIVEFLGVLEKAREGMYRTGLPITMFIGTVADCDKQLEFFRDILADLRKFQAVEREAHDYDIAMRMVEKNGVVTGRPPEGRDYHELFAILSPTPGKKEKV